MRFAKDQKGDRVCADNAIRNEEYLCPSCNKALVLKRGKILLPHFAHFPHQPCTDNWTYDESPWQQKWQGKFPADSQEVIVSHSTQSHRADIIIGNNVVLFQQTAITAKFFFEKTKYFQHDGKDVFWIINVDEDLAAGILRVNPRDRNKMFWDYPPAFLKKVDLKKNKKLHILLDMGKGRLVKVEWVAPDSGFTRFIVDSSFKPDIFTPEGCELAKLNQYGRFEELKRQSMPWHKKAGTTSKAPETSWYGCDKTGKEHCDHCKQCEHNLITEYRSENFKTNIPAGTFYYCCYPRVMHEMVAEENGAAKNGVPSIWLK